MSELIYMKSQRNKTILYSEGFAYNESGVLKGLKRYRCRQRSCYGKILVSSSNEVTELTPHNHLGDAQKIMAEVSAKKIKDRALETTEAPRSVVANVLRDLNESERLETPKLKSMRDSVTKARNKEFGNLNVLVQHGNISEASKLNSRGHPFIIFDSRVDANERYLIFCSENQKSYLEKSDIWIIDGTFKCVPSNFVQLVCIRGLILGKSYPLAFLVLTSKKESLYLDAFRFLHGSINFSQPKHIIVDFERALINALKNTFTESNMHGCLFHFSQSIWRKIQSFGLVQDYKRKKDIFEIYKKCMYLVFFPDEEIYSNFQAFKRYFYSKPVSGSCKRFLQYFENTYILESEHSYPVKFWSCYQRITSEIPRTTNSSEAWHASLNRQTLLSNPSMAKLFEVLKSEEDITAFSLTRLFNGRDIPVAKCDYKKEFQLRQICMNREHFNNDSYCEALQNVYKFKTN